MRFNAALLRMSFPERHVGNLKKSDFYYDLPRELIAQHPVKRRDCSRLMALDKTTGGISHMMFSDITELLREGDCLILNDTKVLPSRLIGTKEGTGAKVEFLLLNQKGADIWEALAGPGKRAKTGSRFTFGGGAASCEVARLLDNGNRLLRFLFDGDFFELLDKIGEMPLPHYITEKLQDRERYQTVFARDPGSAAAPTAGLHFTPELLEKIRGKGVETGFITLHVGLGTFRPVKTDDISEHHMHSEHYHIPKRTADAVNRAKRGGGRVIAVGTTCCRALESVCRDKGSVCEYDAWTDIFIYPGYSFKCADALITNFHLPESTLIMLVSAFCGHDNTMRAYAEAINEGYRYFSFGDAMFISD